MAETQTRQQGGQSPLRIDRGTTIINDAVVVSIAGAVVKEISGADPEIGGRSASIPGDNSPTGLQPQFLADYWHGTVETLADNGAAGRLQASFVLFNESVRCG